MVNEAQNVTDILLLCKGTNKDRRLEVINLCILELSDNSSAVLVKKVF